MKDLGLKKRDFWGKENAVNSEYEESIVLATDIHEAVDEVQQRIQKLKNLTERSMCSNEELAEHRRNMIGYMEREVGALEKSIDSYMNQIY